MNEFRLIVGDIRLPSHIDQGAAERFYHRAVDAVTDLILASEATPGYFRWMKAMEALGEEIAATFEKPAREAQNTPDQPPPHEVGSANAPNPVRESNSGGFDLVERL